MRVLIVEDERKLAQVLVSALQAEHYDVVVAATGEDGFYRANAELLDLVVLDLMLPGRSGLEILQTLRQRRIEFQLHIDGGPAAPVIGLANLARQAHVEFQRHRFLLEFARERKGVQATATPWRR